MQIELLPETHKQVYQELWAKKSRLPQVLLLSGDKFSGVDLLATNFIAALLCKNLGDNHLACGSCESCQLILEDSHPDILNLSKEREQIESKFINIDLICRAIDFVYFNPNYSNYRIIYIDDMNTLNLNSANSLLKILEEPPIHGLFILVTYNLSGILPTILSRCHAISLKPSQLSIQADTNKGMAEFWKSYYRNQPLVIQPIADDELNLLINTLITPSIDNIFSCCEIFNGKNISFGFSLEFIYKWLTELVMFISTKQLLIFNEHHLAITRLVSRINKDEVFYLFDEINFLLKWANHPLNYKLQLENIFFKYQRLFSNESSA